MKLLDNTYRELINSKDINNTIIIYYKLITLDKRKLV
jgi:hypothetical protein